MSLTSTSSVVAVDALLVRDVDGQYRPARADEVLSQARRVLSRRVRRGATMSSPQAVKDYLRLEIGVLEHEVFCVLFAVPDHRAEADVPRHGDADLGVPARGRQGRARVQCRGRPAGAFCGAPQNAPYVPRIVMCPSP